MQPSREIDLFLPDVGDADTMELVCWHKKPGEHFEKGEDLCDLVTDKAAFSLEAPQAGVLLAVHIPDHEQVKKGQIAARVRLD